MDLPQSLTSRFKFDLKKDRIGYGGSALVYKAKDTQLERVVAIKMLSTNPDRIESDLLQEIRRAIKLDHPNILRYYELKEWDEKDESGNTKTKRAVVMEYAHGGDLAKFIGRTPPLKDKQKIITDLLEGLKYLHSQKVIHVDLKPENIFIQEIDGKITAKIADFGLSISLDKPEEVSSYLDGSLNYLAPERLNPGKYFEGLKFVPPTIEADLWALGAIIYFIFTGKAPFQETGGHFNTNEVIAYKITEEKIPEEVSRIPEPYQLIVRRCLMKDPQDRVNSIEKLIKVMHDHNASENRKRLAAIQSQKSAESIIPTKETKKESKTPPKSSSPEEKKWKLEITCADCGEENKGNKLRCSNCNNVLKGPLWLKSFHSAGGIGLVIFLALLTAQIVWPLAEVLQISGWTASNYNLTPHLEQLEVNMTEEFELTSFWVQTILMGLTWLITAILFAGWVNRAHRNLDSLNAKKLKFTHSVGGLLFALPLFVPQILAAFVIGSDQTELIWLPFVAGVVCLMLPFFYMKETWKGSNPQLLDASGLSWKKGKGSLMLFSWWITSLLFPVSIFIPFIPGLGLVSDIGAEISPIWWTISIVLLVAGTSLTALLIARINYRQNQRFKNIIIVWENRD